MSQPELLKFVAEQLGKAGIPLMVTGSLASSLQGEPRLSHDIDLVVQISGAHVSPLLAAFPSPRYYLSEAAIREAIRSQRTFNLLDTESGDKVDFWLLTDSPFDKSRFSRRTEEDMSGVRCAVSTPEDTILQKLAWCKEYGGSEKQFTDALRVYEVQYESLDPQYIDDWSQRLGVEELLARLRNEANPP